MKKLISLTGVTLLIVAMTSTLSAQKSLVKKGNKLYELKAYAEAIPYYEKALLKDSNISQAIINLADCYRLTNNSRQALRYYARVIKLPAAQPIHTYYYAQALMQNGAYEDARKYMSQYKDDERGKAFEKAIEKLSQFYKDSSYYRILPVNFNSAQNDFSPFILNDNKIIFVSARQRTQWVSYTHPWTDLKYYTVYITQKDNFGSYKKPRKYQRNLQIKYNDGPISMDKEGKTIVITRNNFRNNKVVRASNGDIKLNLYQADWNEAKRRFVNLRGFDFNRDEYNTAHPALSPDGQRLYFSSDMPGTYGGMDLWVCYRQGDGWSDPVNLGKKVNTPGDEVFPYVLNQNKLYFSSNGLDGIGGLDLFSVNLNEKGLPYDEPKNMGSPMNSPADDFGIAFFSDGKRGFFSSNRANFDLDDNIYEFIIDKPEKKIYTILVMDSASRTLLESDLVITDFETNERTEFHRKNGTYEVELNTDRLFLLSAYSPEHKPKLHIQYRTPEDNTKPFEILLAPKSLYFIAGTVYEVLSDSTSVTLDSAYVTIMDSEGNTVCGPFITKKDGKYRSCDLLPNTMYIVSVTRDGFLSKSSIVPFIPPGGAIRDFYLNRGVIGKAIKIENIYFDLDKSYIREDAKPALDKIVKLMKDNPDIIVELSSHTDCRASYAYNMALSDRRAKASAAYIISKGIEPSRIRGKGYGETQLVTNCPCEGNQKSDCSEEEHQLNRRTEFTIIGYVKGIGNVKVKSTK